MCKNSLSKPKSGEAFSPACAFESCTIDFTSRSASNLVRLLHSLTLRKEIPFSPLDAWQTVTASFVERLEAFCSSEPQSPLLEDGLITMALGSSLYSWPGKKWELLVGISVFSLLVAFLILWSKTSQEADPWRVGSARFGSQLERLLCCIERLGGSVAGVWLPTHIWADWGQEVGLGYKP